MDPHGVPVPVPADALAAALRPFGESTMLPAVAYVSPEVFAWEQRRFFAGTWSCLGRAADLLPGAQTQRALVVGDVPVLLASTGDGPRAFANTCRHRGHELLPAGATSTRAALVCPYHGWSYDVAGNLLAAPGLPANASFDPADHGLVRLPSQVWHGWLFVNAPNDGPAFAEHVGALAELVAPYAPQRLLLGARRDEAARRRADHVA